MESTKRKVVDFIVVSVLATTTTKKQKSLCWSLMTRLRIAKDSTLHEQGVPEAELVDPVNEDKEEICINLFWTRELKS